MDARPGVTAWNARTARAAVSCRRSVTLNSVRYTGLGPQRCNTPGYRPKSFHSVTNLDNVTGENSYSLPVMSPSVSLDRHPDECPSPGTAQQVARLAREPGGRAPGPRPRGSDIRAVVRWSARDRAASRR